jgi:hypothetical protein
MCVCVCACGKQLIRNNIDEEKVKFVIYIQFILKALLHKSIKYNITRVARNDRTRAFVFDHRKQHVYRRNE